MHIVFALPGLHRIRRGAEVALESVAHEIAMAGKHQVTVIGSGEQLPDRAYRFKHVPAVSRSHFEKWPRMPFLRSEHMYEELTFALNALGRSWTVDADMTVTCGYPYASWALRRGGKAKPRHVFVTQNGDWPASGQSAEARFFSCDGLICTNPIYLARNRERWKSTLIPNGVDIAQFHPGEGDRDRLGLPRDAKLVLMVSALESWKRVLQAVRAVSSVEGVHLVLAGDGPLRAEVNELGAELMPGRFTCRTFSREAMPDLYRSADLFLHAAMGESFGNVYIEALSSGLPVVAHDEDVTRWILGRYATLVDTHSEQAMSEAVRRALKTPRSDKMEASEWAHSRYGWRKIAAEYAEFLELIARAEVERPVNRDAERFLDVRKDTEHLRAGASAK